MMTFLDLKVFDTVPENSQKPGLRGLFGAVKVTGGAPKTFVEGTTAVIDLVLIIWALLIVSNGSHRPLATVISIEVLFLASLVLLIIAGPSPHFPAVVACYAFALILSALLNFFFPNDWGNAGLFAAYGFALYRFPLRWSWPFVVAGIAVLVWTNGLLNYLLTRNAAAGGSLLTLILLAALICWTAWTRRVRHLLIVELQEVQAQLRAEMARTEELATARERARIARDIHDVLAHTLTVLSIQVQATRQLIQHAPDRAAAKLDDMATLLRESIAESRRVVGLLRETSISSVSHGDVGKRLLVLSERFGERTGTRCIFEEEGIARPLSAEQGETLARALQEALTNAYRHGSAQHVEAKLRWQESQVILQVRDDGHTSPIQQHSEGSHQGLQGMRERAIASGGSLEAGPQPQGGFMVTLCLPLQKEQLPHSQGGLA